MFCEFLCLLMLNTSFYDHFQSHYPQYFDTLIIKSIQETSMNFPSTILFLDKPLTHDMRILFKSIAHSLYVRHPQAVTSSTIQFVPCLFRYLTLLHRTFSNGIFFSIDSHHRFFLVPL